MGFEAILTSTVGESKARQQLADELLVRLLLWSRSPPKGARALTPPSFVSILHLQRSVYLPFSKWSAAHSTRIHQSQETVEKVLISWEHEKSIVEKLREVYGEKCRWLDEVEDELEFVRGREALMRSTSNSGIDSGDEEKRGNQARGGSGGGGGVVLPPRPFEIDQQSDSTVPLSPSTSSRSVRFNRHAKNDEDQGSEDGSLPPIDNGYEQDGFIDRTGATGGSVVAALGRALTVRRNRATSGEKEKQTGNASSAVIEGEAGDREGGWKVEKLMEDKKVKAALDFSKTKSVLVSFYRSPS